MTSTTPTNTTPGPGAPEDAAPPAAVDPLDVAQRALEAIRRLAEPIDNAPTAKDRQLALIDARVNKRGQTQHQLSEQAAQMAQVSVAMDVRKIANALPLLSSTVGSVGELVLPYVGQLLTDVTRIAERIDADAFRVTATTEGGDQVIYARSFTAAAGLVDELTGKGAEAVNIAERDEDGLWNNIAVYQQGAWHL